MPSPRALTSLLAVLALACAAGCGSGGDQAEPRQGRADATADAFVDSIGVNVHMSYTDTPYGRVDDVRRRLRELGIRHVRDGLVVGRPDQYAALNALAEDGIRSQLILGDPQGRFGSGSLEDQLTTLKGELRGAVAAVEGPNEYDVSGDPRWRDALRGYQRRLAAGIEADPALARLPVVGPSLVEPPSRVELGSLTEALEFGNLHSYPGGRPPERNLAEELELAFPVSGRERVMATETGYHDAVEAEVGQPPVSERASAVYLPRLYLHYFRSGVRRTFAYELLDQRADPARTDPEANFGLLDETLAPKPAFEALRNLITVLRDSGEPGETGTPAYRLTGENRSIGRLALRQRDGSLSLVLWQESRVWDESRRVDLRTRASRVRVELEATVPAVTVFRPGRSTRAAARVEDVRTLPLEVGPEPIVVRLSAG